MSRFVNIGFGNVVNVEHIIAIISPDSAPAKRLIQKAKEAGHVVDGTQGRKTKSILVSENEILILSALLPETLAARAMPDANTNTKEESVHED